MLWPKKICTRNLVTKKNSFGSKIPPPTPAHNFSNGPSLKTQKGVIAIVPGGPSEDRGNWD